MNETGVYRDMRSLALTANQLVGWGVAIYRRLGGMRQEDLAAQVGMTQPTLSRLERGIRGASLAELAAIAAVLRVSPMWLVELPAAVVEALQARSPERGGEFNKHVLATFRRPQFDDPAFTLGDLRRFIASVRGFEDVDVPISGDLSPRKASVRERAVRIVTSER